jgi:hypothetical protein
MVIYLEKTIWKRQIIKCRTVKLKLQVLDFGFLYELINVPVLYVFSW